MGAGRHSQAVQEKTTSQDPNEGTCPPGRCSFRPTRLGAAAALGGGGSEGVPVPRFIRNVYLFPPCGGRERTVPEHQSARAKWLNADVALRGSQ